MKKFFALLVFLLLLATELMPQVMPEKTNDVSNNDNNVVSVMADFMLE